MKFACAVLISAGLLAAAPQAGNPAAAAPQAGKPAAAAPARRLEIPPGAVEREPGRFFSTDYDGR